MAKPISAKESQKKIIIKKKIILIILVLFFTIYRFKNMNIKKFIIPMYIQVKE